MRADLRLVELGLVPSRARAQAEIKAGGVFHDGRKIERSSDEVPADAVLKIDELANAFVSRGALKLVHALDHFGIDVSDSVALDIGASTGGFTEVLLVQGAARVYAVDVGHGQLHPKLRSDPQVIAVEGVNARSISRAVVPEPVDMIVADVSFISLKLALPAAFALAAPRAVLVALIKPQFEAGRGLVKKGVVRDEAVHRQVCEDISAWIDERGWRVLGVTPSPMLGGDGNREFLIAAHHTGE